MAALKSPMMQSPSNSLISTFSPYSESPTSPQRFDSPPNRPMSTELGSHIPAHLYPPSTSSPLATSSPSTDIADPSPIATSSTGTDTTDIDDTAVEHEEPAEPLPEPPRSAKPLLEVETKRAMAEATRPRSDDDEQPSSVIHAPQGFEAFHRQSPPSVRKTTPTQPQQPDVVLLPPTDEAPSIDKKPSRQSPISPPALQTSVPPARDWSATPRAQTRLEVDQSLEPKEADNKKASSRSSSRASTLADIPESHDAEQSSSRISNPNATLFENTVERLKEQEDNVAALNIALLECWTLCNTLAGLSYVHRQKIFHFGRGDQQEQAWKSCWKLCQTLYETRDEEVVQQIRPTLDLCREFCQCLFEVRRKDDEAADSVLRVSFELNNHLYNTHDRSLPEAFRERTLDFYITLCHRLMKQRSHIKKETDSLLGACWSLAEMLFSIRQNKREGRKADEELLGSAVQACWELCDLFREGWTQVRPDRGTPRPSQTTFAQAFHQAKQSQSQPSSASSSFWAEVPDPDESEDEDFGRQNPETPTTVFEDVQQESSDDDNSAPNILVLGTGDQNSREQQASLQWRQQQNAQVAQWQSDRGGTLARKSQGSSTGRGGGSGRPGPQSNSSSSTILKDDDGSATDQSNGPMESEDARLTCLKLLIVKAAMNLGYQRPSASPPAQSSQQPNHQTLAAFVKAMPSNSFGTKPWQLQLLDSYKKLVASDPTFRNPFITTKTSVVNGSAASSQSITPPIGSSSTTSDVASKPSSPPPSTSSIVVSVRRARAVDVARSVRWLVASQPQYTWLGDLFRWVFGFHLEEGERRPDVMIQN